MSPTPSALLRTLGATIAATLVVVAASPAMAATYNVTPADDWVAMLKGLQAGDTMILGAGDYMTGGKVDLNLQGTELMPIKVMGDPAGDRPHIIGVSNQNTFDLGGSWYHFEYLEFTGGSHGIRVETSSHGTFRDLEMHDLGDVGFSMNRTGHSYDNMHITLCEIYDTGKGQDALGEGMYIGCNDGSCVVSSSRFDFNFVHDIGGSQGDGIEIKKNSWGNVVADNIVVNTNYPGITMYGYDAVSMPRNVVERNLVWVTWDNGIQVNGQVIVRNNIVIGAGTNGANGIHSKPTSPHLPNDVDIINNTVIDAGGVCLRTNNWDQAANQVVANNALYCPNSSAVKVVGNSSSMVWANNAVLGGVEGNSVVTAGTAVAGTSVAGDFVNGSAIDVYPASGGVLIGAGDATLAPADDFNQTPRTGAAEIGAYAWSAAGNPITIVGDGIKTAPGPPMVDEGPEIAPDSPAEQPADMPADGPTDAAPDMSEVTEEVVSEPMPDTAPDAGSDTSGGPDTTASDANGPDAAPDSGPTTDTGADTTASGDTTAAVDAQVDTKPSTPPLDDGCSGGRPLTGAGWLGLALLGVFLLRRRSTGATVA